MSADAKAEAEKLTKLDYVAKLVYKDKVFHIDRPWITADPGHTHEMLPYKKIVKCKTCNLHMNPTHWGCTS